MHRTSLLNLLKNFENSSYVTDIERPMLDDIKAFVSDNPNCFERSLLSGHVTGSSFIVNDEKNAALLMHHRKLNRWFQPGGHADGDFDILRVAAKEALEETGISGLEPIIEGIFDVDVHEIGARSNEPAHLHYDIRFLFIAPKNARFVVGEESFALKWVPFNEIHQVDCSASVVRMIEKFKQMFI